MREFIELMRERGHVIDVEEPCDPVFEAPKKASKTDKILFFHNVGDARAVMNVTADRGSLAAALGMEARNMVRQLAATEPDGRVVTGSTLSGGPVDLSVVTGLADALNQLVAGAAIDPQRYVPEGFDLNRYESHIRAHLKRFPVGFDEIPPLSDDFRLDRIWRFIAIIFMAHSGLIRIEQDDPEILVMHREAD